MLAALWLAAASQLSLVILYNERPPYAITAPPGSPPHGLTATPVTHAAAAAGITLEWQQAPEQRQLALIQANQGAVCGLGWYLREERRQLGRYSQAIFRDGPQLVVTRRGHAAIQPPLQLDSLLQRDDLVMLRRAGFSYGPHADPLLQRHQPPSFTISAPQQALAIMLAEGRGDYLLANREEALWLASPPQTQQPLQLLPLVDGDAGEYRYLLCSFATSDELINRINTQLPPLDQPSLRSE